MPQSIDFGAVSIEGLAVLCATAATGGRSQRISLTLVMVDDTTARHSSSRKGNTTKKSPGKEWNEVFAIGLSPGDGNAARLP